MSIGIFYEYSLVINSENVLSFEESSIFAFDKNSFFSASPQFGVFGFPEASSQIPI